MCWFLLQERLETKLTSSSKELMKLIEGARSGGLQPDKLMDVLSAASLAAGQDCRSQLLMQLILLIQQQLTAASENTAVNDHGHTDNTTVKPLHDGTSGAAWKVIGDAAAETGDNTSGEENEMDKLLSWKSRIENASLTSNDQLSSSVNEHSTAIPDPASPDVTPVNSSSETNGKSFSLAVDDNTSLSAAPSETTSCVESETVLPISSPPEPIRHLLDPSSPASSPASPVEISVEYPPLPLPPKPPANLLMNIDRKDLSCSLLPHPPLLDSADCTSSSATLLNSHDVDKSAATACHPCLPVPCCFDAATSFDAYSSVSSDTQPHDMPWPNVSAASNVHRSIHCPVMSATDSHVPLTTFCQDSSSQIISSSSMELSSTQSHAGKPLQFVSYPHLMSVQEVLAEPHDKRSPSQDLFCQQRRATRLQSPSTRLQSPSAWLSRLASPSAFMLQSGVPRSHIAADAGVSTETAAYRCPKLDDHSSVTEMSHSVCYSGQDLLQHPPAAVDSHTSVEQSGTFHMTSHCTTADELSVAVGERQLTDFDKVSSDTNAYLPDYGAGFDTDYRSTVVSHGNQSANSSAAVRLSADKALLSLAGMPVGSDLADDCYIATASDRDAATHALPAAPQCEEPIRQVAVCTETSRSDCVTDMFDANSTVYALSRPAVDNEVTANDTCRHHSPDMSCGKPFTSPVQTATDVHLQDVQDEDDLEEGEIIDDISPTRTINQHELPQATKQLLSFLKTDPVRKSSSSHAVVTEPPRRHHVDRPRQDFDKYHRSNSANRRRW